MARPRIAAAHGVFDPAWVARAAAGAKADVVSGSVESPADVAALCEGADALLVVLERLREEHIDAIPRSVKVIARSGVGLDTIDVEAAHHRGIQVIYQPSYATGEVADHAAAMALASWRRLARADAVIRQSGWGGIPQVGTIHSLQDAILGVLGLGRIGRAVIDRLAVFVAGVVAHDAVKTQELGSIAWADSVAELLPRSNLLTLHLPLIPETRHIIDRAAIELMPDESVLVNVSRGGLVDERALADALAEGKLSAAALDVFESEPLDPDSPLRAAPNLILTPHIAWYSAQSGVRLATWSVEDAAEFVRTGTIIHGQIA